MSRSCKRNCCDFSLTLDWSDSSPDVQGKCKDAASSTVLYKFRRVWTRVKQRSVTQGVVDAWNRLDGKVVVTETVDKFELKLDRYLEVLEIEGDREVDRTFKYLDG